LFSLYLTLGQQAAHFDGELDAINIALKQIFSTIRSFKKAVIFSDSTAATQSLAKFDALPARVTEIHPSIEDLENLHKDIKFHWIPSHCGVVAKEIADYVVKKGTTISQTSLCKLPFNSAKLGIKRNIPADFSRYYASESQHKPWNKMVKNRNIILDFPRGNAVATF
jgi:hypothetical protein